MRWAIMTILKKTARFDKEHTCLFIHWLNKSNFKIKKTTYFVFYNLYRRKLTCQESTPGPDCIVTSDHQAHDHNYCDSSQQEKDTKDQSTEGRKPDNSLTRNSECLIDHKHLSSNFSKHIMFFV